MKVKLTSKRQATFPIDLCHDLGLQPGDAIELEPRIDEGRKYWVLKKAAGKARPWVGSLKNYYSNSAESAPSEASRLPANLRPARRFTVFGNA